MSERVSNNEAWNFALGMIKIDGLEPTEDFLELVEKEKAGEITTNDITKILNRKYRAIADEEEKE